MMKSQDIGLDTSALRRFLEENADAEIFKVVAKKHRLIIPTGAIFELRDIPDPAHSKKVFNKLGELFEDIKNIQIAKDLRETLDAEAQTAPSSIQLINREEKRPLVAAFCSKKPLTKLNKRNISNNKEEFKKSDEQAREWAKEKFPDHAELVKFRSSFDAITPQNAWVELYAERLNKKFVLSDFWKRPKDYRALYTFAACSEYYALGAIIDPEAKRTAGFKEDQGWKLERGSHYDSKIAGETAYCDFLIVEDHNFYVRAKYLYEKKVIRQHPLKIDEIQKHLLPK